MGSGQDCKKDKASILESSLYCIRTLRHQLQQANAELRKWAEHSLMNQACSDSPLLGHSSGEGAAEANKMAFPPEESMAIRMMGDKTHGSL